MVHLHPAWPPCFDNRPIMWPTYGFCFLLIIMLWCSSYQQLDSDLSDLFSRNAISILNIIIIWSFWSFPYHNITWCFHSHFHIIMTWWYLPMSLWPNDRLIFDANHLSNHAHDMIISNDYYHSHHLDVNIIMITDVHHQWTSFIAFIASSSNWIACTRIIQFPIFSWYDYLKWSLSFFHCNHHCDVNITMTIDAHLNKHHSLHSLHLP